MTQASPFPRARGRKARISLLVCEQVIQEGDSFKKTNNNDRDVEVLWFLSTLSSITFIEFG